MKVTASARLFSFGARSRCDVPAAASRTQPRHGRARTYGMRGQLGQEELKIVNKNSMMN